MADVLLDNPTEDELPVALELFYHQLSLADRDRAVSETIKLYKQDELLLEDLILLRENDEITSIIICTVEVGAIGRCWPPQTRALSGQQDLEDQLVRTALARLIAADVSLVQCLLLPIENDQASPFLRNGFQHISPLLLMERTLEGVEKFAFMDGPPGVVLEPFCDENSDLFLETLLATYEDSLDFPELIGARQGPDILAGHRAQGEFDPDRWLLVRDSSEPIGVMLLTEVSEWKEWELSYLGIVPKARRKGFGRYLVSEAIWQAHLGQAERLMVAVDERNQAALSLYSAFGFETIQKHETYLYFPAVKSAEG
ncbi:MAG: GNAT family N-acetyltransferase [Gemmataceae bacterium]